MFSQYNFFQKDVDLIALEKMILLRQTEKFIEDLHRQKKIVGPCHLGIGQEAIAAAISAFINPSTDSVFASHRSHNAYLATTRDVGGLLAELARKSFGCSGGRGGSTYLTNPDKGFVCSTPILTGGIGLATGAAIAKTFKNDTGMSIVFFGDGAVEEGMFHEALNFASVFSAPVLFVCENNQLSCNVDISLRQPPRSISSLAQSHGILSRSIDGNDYFQVYEATQELVGICREERRPVFLEANTFRISSHTGTDPTRDIGVPRDLEQIEKWKSHDPISKFVESPIANQKVCAQTLREIQEKVDEYLQTIWQRIKQLQSPVAKKNQSPKVYSGTSSFPHYLETTVAPSSNCTYTYLQGLQDGIEVALKAEPSTILVGQGVSSPWDSGKWVMRIYDDFKDTQIFESPNSESATTAAAIGMSMAGVRCIVNHPRMDFLILSSDPIVNQASKAYYMSGGKVKVPVVIRCQLYRGNCQGGQHSQSLHSWFSHVPGLRVVMPATPSDARNLLLSAVFSDDPVLFVDDKWLHDWAPPIQQSHSLDLIHEGPQILRDGKDITLVGMGFTTRLCYEAAEELSRVNIECEVIDLRVLNPIDCEIIAQSCRKTRSLLVVDMSWPQCSVASEIITQVCESLSDDVLRIQMQRFNLPNHPAPASPEDEQKYYIDTKKIKTRILKILSRIQNE